MMFNEFAGLPNATSVMNCACFEHEDKDEINKEVCSLSQSLFRGQAICSNGWNSPPFLRAHIALCNLISTGLQPGGGRRQGAKAVSTAWPWRSVVARWKTVETVSVHPTRSTPG
jgi:hypothetical protein